MRKLFLLLTFCLMLPLCITAAGQSEKVVYLDGTGKTKNAYATLTDALKALPGGGTVVITGNTVIDKATTLPKTGAIVITSKYGNEDYTKTASLQIAASLTLGGDTTFRDIVLERTEYTGTAIYLYAAGNPITVDSGVVCLNYTGKSNLSIVGGVESGDYTGDSHVTVKSGLFRNVYGGNRAGNFTGNSYVEITGGAFDNSVCGGSYTGNFTGDAHLTFAGNASLLYTSSTQGLIGGTLGDGSHACVFTGNIYMKLGGKCGINHNIIGASRNKNTTTKGNVEILIEENAYAYYSLYAGGYSTGLDGSTRVIVNGGDFNGSLYGGSHAGTVTGDTYIEINGGKLCYYQVNGFSSGSDIAGTKNVYAAGDTGSTVKGNATIVMNGGSVYGDLVGKSSITLTGGTVFGDVQSSNTTIDLSGGGHVSIGATSIVKSLIGGGKLVLAPATKITAMKLSGKTELIIDGTPLPITYITAPIAEEGAGFTYTPQADEKLVTEGKNYNITFDGAYATTAVTVQHKDGFEVRLRAGRDTSASTLSAAKTTATSATYNLKPGLYNVTVVSKDTNSNYKRKALYIDGRSATHTLNVEFDKLDKGGFDFKVAYFHSDEMIAKYYDENDVEGYFQPDTPFFNKRYGTSSVYTTNAEITEFLAEKSKNCAYMYVYDVAKSPYGYSVPAVLFTLDPIPAGASIEEAAAIVGKTAGRDILMFTGGTHGDEPTGTEGTLAFISEMCGDYGKSVLQGTNVGAVIVMPRINPDGAKDFIRNRPTTTSIGIGNLNRDYMATSSAEVASAVRVYQLFMPTLTLDCHEAKAGPRWSDAQFTTDIYDAGMKPQGALMSAGDLLAVINGDRTAADNDAGRVANEALEALTEKGLRIFHYEPSANSAMNTNYFGLLGSYSYLLEIPGIVGGESGIARRTYSQLCGIKALVSIALETDGEMARNVANTRAEMAKSAQVYDGKTPVILQSAMSRADERRIEWNNPLIGADTTVRVAENLTYMYQYDTAIRYRTLPTAYVMAADAKGITEILAVLDKQGIAYKKLAEGTTLTLQRYGGTASSATLEAPAEVTFAKGAFLVPVDGARAYVTALLFEPDVSDEGDAKTSFMGMEYTTVASIYRSTESYIAAKHGIAGSYYALPANGKKIASVQADGKAAEVITDGGYSIIRTPEVSATVTYTDGTSETISFGEGEAPAAIGVTLKMTLGKTDYTVNDKKRTMDVAPIIRNSRTMLPVRYVAEALGATIAWDGATSTATLKTADTELRITVGAAEAIVNGKAVKLDSPAFIESSRTYMPVRFVAETLGASVAWDGATSTATITK